MSEDIFKKLELSGFTIKTIYIAKGLTLTIEATVIDENGNPFDLTDTTINLLVKEEAGGTTILSKSTAPGGGIVITNPTGGIFDIYFYPTDTATITEDSIYFYYCNISNLAGEVFPLIAGNFDITLI